MSFLESMKKRIDAAYEKREQIERHNEDLLIEALIQACESFHTRFDKEDGRFVIASTIAWPVFNQSALLNPLASLRHKGIGFAPENGKVMIFIDPAFILSIASEEKLEHVKVEKFFEGIRLQAQNIVTLTCSGVTDLLEKGQLVDFHVIKGYESWLKMLFENEKFNIALNSEGPVCTVNKMCRFRIIPKFENSN